jgi:hypothetical protein
MVEGHKKWEVMSLPIIVSVDVLAYALQPLFQHQT